MLITAVAWQVGGSVWNASASEPNERFVAHAGGIIDGYEGSNSLEAMQQSAANGFRYIEVDLLTTTDNQIILSHDWEQMSNRVPAAANEAVSRDEFMQYKIYNQYSPVDLAGLITFLEENPSIRIITDTKLNDYSALTIIAQQYPTYRNRFIPQVYDFSDYPKIKNLGFDDIIVTLYTMPDPIKTSPKKIVSYAKKYNPFAITIPDELLTDATFIQALNMNHIHYYVHTINAPERADALFDMGIKGIYTDFILPTEEAGNFQTASSNDKEEIKWNEFIGQLTQKQRNALTKVLLYQINNPYVIKNGAVTSLSDSTTGAPFTIGTTKAIYLPVSQIIPLLIKGSYQWHSEDGAVTFTYNEAAYRLTPHKDTYQMTINATPLNKPLQNPLRLYRNMNYLPTELAEEIFSCRVMQKGDYILIIPNESKALEGICADILTSFTERVE